MTLRRALVRIAGVNKELPLGDTLGGVQKVVFSCVGKPGAGEVLGMFVADEQITLYANLLGSVGRAVTGATASTTFSLTQIPAGSNTETVVATFGVAANYSTFLFSSQAAIVLGVGDMLRVKSPSTQDSTLADFSVTLLGFR